MAHYIPTREALLARCGELFDWIGSGDLRVRVGAEFSLSDAAEAHRDLQARRTTGKVLLRP
jgi:NADPH2:quinone reductase